MALSIKGLFATLSMNDAEQKKHSTEQQPAIMLSVVTQCRTSFIAMMNVIMLTHKR